MFGEEYRYMSDRWRCWVAFLGVLLVMTARSATAGQSSSGPRDPVEFQLTSARVLGDGRIVRLQWEAGVAVGQPACNRLANTGFPDYLPGLNEGLSLTVNGMTAECIGTHSQDHNRPQAWLPPPTKGGSLAEGNYMFQVVLADASGNEVVTHGWSAEGHSTGVNPMKGFPVPAGGKLEIQWREPCPKGGALHLYVGYAPPGNNPLTVMGMTLAANVPASRLPTPTSYVLTSVAPGGPPIGYQSTTWYQDWLLPAPIPLALRCRSTPQESDP